MSFHKILEINKAFPKKNTFLGIFDDALVYKILIINDIGEEAIVNIPVIDSKLIKILNNGFSKHSRFYFNTSFALFGYYDYDEVIESKEAKQSIVNSLYRLDDPPHIFIPNKKELSYLTTNQFYLDLQKNIFDDIDILSFDNLNKIITKNSIYKEDNMFIVLEMLDLLLKKTHSLYCKKPLKEKYKLEVQRYLKYKKTY